jgi:VWFA-related protein
MRTKLLRTAAVLVGLACTTVSSSGQKSEDRRAAPSFRTGVSLVEMDVIATDRSGRSVTDLRPDELVVIDGGQKRPVRKLELEHAQSDAPQSRAAQAKVEAILAKLPPDLYTNLKAVAAVPVGTASMLLLADVLNTPMMQRADVRRELFDFLKHSSPNQPIAIYSLTDRLELMQDFTSDTRSLLAAMQEVQTSSAHGGVYDTRGQALGTLDQAQAAADIGNVISRSMKNLAPGVSSSDFTDAVARFEDFRAGLALEARIIITLRSLNEIARRMESIPGRKNLVWVASSFVCTMDPTKMLKDEPSSICARHQEEISDTLRNLERAHVALYPVDTNGLQTNPALDVEKAGVSQGTRTMFESGTNAFLLNRAVSMTEMERFAANTGGRAFYNTNGLGSAVQAAMQDGSEYYALTFSPRSEVADGKFHPVRIECKRRGVVLRYRGGYFTPLSRGPVDAAEAAKAAQGTLPPEIEDALSSRLPSTGVVLYAKRDTSNASDPWVMDVIVDPHSLTFQQEENGDYRADIDIATGTLSPRGSLLTSNRARLSKRLTPAETRQALLAGVVMRVPLIADRQAKTARVLVRDLPTGRIGTVDVPLPGGTNVLSLPQKKN